MKTPDPSLPLAALLLLAVPISVHAEWTTSVSVGTELSSSINTGKIHEPDYKHKLAPGVVIGYFPDFDTEAYYKNSIHSFRSEFISVDVAYRMKLGSRFRQSFGLKAETAHNDITYNVSHWLVFWGYNPFSYYGDIRDRYLDGSGLIHTKSISLTPELFERTEIDISQKLSAYLELGVGVSYFRYDTYDFATPTNELWPLVDEGYAVDQYSDNEVSAYRYRAGLGITYAFSPKWTAYAMFDVTLHSDINLRNTIKSADDCYITQTLPIEKQVSQRLSLGMQYSF